jgi:hypothetical protein
MMQKPGYQLAELNVGRLLAPTDDPRVAEFMGALDRVNALGKRMPGFVWMMEGSGQPGTGNTDAKIDGDAQFVSNLTVWQDVASLEAFVWNTVYNHKPTLDEALDRLAHLQANGDTDQAFGWSYLTEAQAWKTHQCTKIAAE